MDIKQHFGQTIRELRGDRQQQELAAAAGLSPSTWSRYEKGRAYPRPDNRGKVARAFGLDLDKLDSLVFRRCALYTERRLSGEIEAAPGNDERSELGNAHWRDMACKILPPIGVVDPRDYDELGVLLQSLVRLLRRRGVDAAT